MIEQITKEGERISKLTFCVSLFFLFCISSLRWERGTDWSSYYNLFLHLDSFQHDFHYEYGYVLFAKIIRFFTDNYTIFLFAQNLIYYSILFLIVRKINSKLTTNIGTSFGMTLLFFAFSQNFAGVFNARSDVAYLLCLYSIFDIFEKKDKLFLLKIFLAIFIHKSTILFLLAYPIFNFGKLDKKFIFFTVCIAVCGMLLVPYSDHLFKYVFFESYEDYIISKDNSIFGFGLIRWMVIIIFALYFKRFTLINPFVEQNLLKFYDGCVKLMLFGLALYVWSRVFSSVALRIAGLFLNVSFLWLPLVFKNLKPCERYIVGVFVILYCALCLQNLLGGAYGNLYIPFKFVWDDFIVETF